MAPKQKSNNRSGGKPGKIDSEKSYLNAHWWPYSLHSSTSSQTPLGPGANPSAQAHSKPPTVLLQVPLWPQERGLMEHSSLSRQERPFWEKTSYIWGET